MQNFYLVLQCIQSIGGAAALPAPPLNPPLTVITVIILLGLHYFFPLGSVLSVSNYRR